MEMEVMGDEESGDCCAVTLLHSLTHTHTGEYECQNRIHKHTHKPTEVVCIRPGFCRAEQAASQQSPYGPVLKSEHSGREGLSDRGRERRMMGRKGRKIYRRGETDEGG